MSEDFIPMNSLERFSGWLSGIVTRSMTLFKKTITSNGAKHLHNPASADFLHSIIQASRDVIYRLNLDDDQFEFVSDVSEEVLGYPADIVMQWGAQGLLEHVHSNDREMLMDEFRRLGDFARTGMGAAEAEFSLEYRIQHRDYSWVWVSDSRRIIRERDGASILVGALRDVTARKRSEEALNFDPAEFSALKQEAPYRIWYKDADLRFRFVQDHFADLNGKKREDYIGKSDYDLFPAEEAKRFQAEDRKVLDSGKPEIVSKIHQLGEKDEKIVSYHKYPVYKAGNELDGLLYVGCDITRRVRALNKLMHYSAIIQASPDMVVSLTPKDEIISWNPAAVEMTGHRENAVKGREIYAILPQEEHQTMRACLDAAREGKGSRDVEMRLLRTGSSERYISLTVSPLPAGGDSIGGIVLLGRDVTETLRVQDALNQYAEDLSRSLADMRQFANVASHDLQEPLRKIALFLDLLKSRYGFLLKDDAHQYVEVAIRNAKQIRQMLNDLLTYASAAEKDKASGSISLDECLAKALEELAPAIEMQQAEIRVQSLPRIHGNQEKMTRVFIHLLDNALRYSGEDQPGIEVDKRYHKRATGGGEWIISIRDRGIGISEQHQEKVFCLFQRLEKNRHSGGTGIGLSICRKIIESMGGRIWLESESGNGCTVSFALPAKEGDLHHA
ncbi:MAG: PAS domain S-box protein [Candidatus Sumerlaeia bacterium]